MWQSFDRKPLRVKAKQWDGKEIIPGLLILEMLQPEYRDIVRKGYLPRVGGDQNATGAIPTNHGFIPVCIDDYVIRGPKGEVHAQPPAVFHLAYEPAQSPDTITDVVNRAVMDGLDKAAN